MSDLESQAVQRLLNQIENNRLPFNGRQDVDLADPAAIAEIANRYDEHIGGRLNAQISAIRRGGPTPNLVRKYPLAWAFDQLKQVEPVQLRTSPDMKTLTALWWVGQFRYLDLKWADYPEFAEKARTLNPGFHHTLGELLLADLLRVGGAQVELLAPSQSRRTPDLGVQVELGDGYIEVKAPEVLQWTLSEAPNQNAVNKALHTAFEGVGQQLDSERPGLLAVICTVPDPETAAAINRAAQLAIRRVGARRPHVHGILTCSGARPVATRVNGRARSGTDFAMGLLLNPSSEAGRIEWARAVFQTLMVGPAGRTPAGGATPA